MTAATSSQSQQQANAGAQLHPQQPTTIPDLYASLSASTTAKAEVPVTVSGLDDGSGKDRLAYESQDQQDSEAHLKPHPLSLDRTLDLASSLMIKYGLDHSPDGSDIESMRSQDGSRVRNRSYFPSRSGDVEPKVGDAVDLWLSASVVSSAT